MGEEKPAAAGHDESAWHLNRRVELIYPARW
jgi:peptidoglycan-associated lipoprotein